MQSARWWVELREAAAHARGGLWSSTAHGHRAVGPDLLSCPPQGSLGFPRGWPGQYLGPDRWQQRQRKWQAWLCKFKEMSEETLELHRIHLHVTLTSDLHETRLCRELNLSEKIIVMIISSRCNKISIRYHLLEIYPNIISPNHPNNVVSAYKMLSIAPLTDAYAQRSFSKLKMIKKFCNLGRVTNITLNQ